MDNLDLLLAWLSVNGFEKEATELLFIKESAGKPLEINRADVDEIVDELIQALGAVLMAYSISPVNLMLMAIGQVGLPDRLDELLQVSVKRKRKDVRGKKINVTYSIGFSDNPSLPPAMVSSSPGDGKEKKLVLGFNPNSMLRKAVESYLGSNLDAIRVDMINPIKSFNHLDRAIRDYLRELIRHEEVHIKDYVPRVGERRINRTYIVKDPSGEEVGKIAENLQINISTLLADNVFKILNPAITNITQRDIDYAISNAQITGTDYVLRSVINRIGKIRLPKGTELKVIRIGATQALTKPNETIRSIAKKKNVDPIRLLVINFNRVLGNPDRPPASFDDIYNLPQHKKDSYMDLELPEGIVLSILPSYAQLYREYHDFYLLTREESKAHYEQAIFNIQKAIEGMSEQEIGSLTLDQMIELSPVAVKYKARLKPKPVDKILKTPIDGKTVERLKQERYKDFMQRMWYYWSEEIRPKA